MHLSQLVCKHICLFNKISINISPKHIVSFSQEYVVGKSSKQDFYYTGKKVIYSQTHDVRLGF